MITKKNYINELTKIKDLDSYPEVKVKFEEAYEIYKLLECSGIKTNATEFANDLLAFLFKTNSGTFNIPGEFINSPLGIVIFSLRFGSRENAFTLSEVALIISRTTALVSDDLKNEKIRAIRRINTILVTESSLYTYMYSKGIGPEECRERVNTYLSLSLEGATIDEIKAAIKDISIKYKINKCRD